ncbi:hypothetical protein Pan241w_00250 [Gimesia alba]|uniref:DUF1559 domain-containing protein n=1 Tax=Gimesia alba TaxID=2527973 RepID=A0A517R7Y3_9PLAN|nr:DUF1559 domain-containing protein [Gimesia alba]QDT39972.1 hypothetical protein Pan241w_00250 [Gimesia alba]
MSIKFQCKKCGKNYKVSDDKAGKKIKCRECAAPVKIPELEVDDFNEDWEEEDEDTPPPPRRRAKSVSKKKSKSKARKKSSSGSNQGLLIVGCVVGVMIMGGVGYFLFSSGKPGGGLAKSIADKVDSVTNSTGQAETVSDVENMKKIGRAFHDFHDSFTRFPPADAHLVDGKPLLSWRVHMLPFLGQAELYKEFNLQEPWDSPQNKALLEKMPAVFKCEGVSQPGSTSIMTFSGDGTPFKGGQGPRLRKFTDGSSNTILVVLAGPDKAVPWTQPIDIPLNASNPISALGQAPRGAFLCTMADGSLKKISVGISPQILKNAIQMDDGNPSPL